MRKRSRYQILEIRNIQNNPKNGQPDECVVRRCRLAAHEPRALHERLFFCCIIVTGIAMKPAVGMPKREAAAGM